MKRTVILSLLIVSALLLSSCGPGQLFGPTLTPMPTATNTPEPTSTPTITPTPQPGLGLSLEEFEAPFIDYGFTFQSYQAGTVQGDYSSPDFQTWTMLILVGEEDLSEATLIVMNGSNQEALAEILTLFFRVAFPDQTNRDAAMSWFANDSGFNSGQDSGQTTVGDLTIGWMRDSVIGFSISFFPAE